MLFRLYDDVTLEQRREAVATLEALGTLPGIREWRIAESLDQRKGRVLVEVGLFEDAAAFAAFRRSPEHAAMAESMSALSDWLVGDYLEEPQA